MDLHSSDRLEPYNGGCTASRSITDLLREIVHTPGTDGVTPARRIAEVLVRRAVAGDVEAIRLVIERVEGSVPDPDGRG